MQQFSIVLTSAAILFCASCDERKLIKKQEAITENTVKADIQRPFINPPITDLNPEYRSLELDARAGATFRLPNTTEIVVPPDAFSSKNGEKLSGKVQLRYRELHDALSIYLAGVPMAYKDGHFTTAGSFELRGSQNNADIVLTKPIKVKMASFTEGSDYPFFYLNENDKKWDSIGWRKPQINLEKQRILSKKSSNFIPFPLNKDYFAFNYMSIVDVYYNDDWNILGSDKRIDSAFNAIKTKLDSYGLGWENNFCSSHHTVNFEGNEYPAALFVWKNIQKKPLPDWVKGRFGTLNKMTDKVYQYKIYNENIDSFFVDIEAVMPLKSLFAFSPTEWKTQYQSNISKIRAEHERAKMMASVYRTFEINQFGLYNWDKPLKEDSKVVVNAVFNFPTAINQRLTDVDMVYISGDNRAVITYPKAKWAEMPLLPDKRGRLFTILPDKTVAIYSVDRYGKLTFEEWRKQNTPPQFQFNLDEKKVVKTQEDLKKILQI